MSFLPPLVRHIDRAGKCSQGGGHGEPADTRKCAEGRSEGGTCICRDRRAFRTAAIGFRALLAVWPCRARVSLRGAGGDDRNVASDRGLFFRFAIVCVLSCSFGGNGRASRADG